MMSCFVLIALLFFSVFNSNTSYLFAEAETSAKTVPVSEEERAKVLKQMQGFSESFQKMPEVPNMNETIILPEREEVNKG